MKNVRCITAMITAVLCLLTMLCACGQSTPSSSSSPATSRSFAAQYIRTDGCGEERQYPIIRLIRSTDELQTYYEEHKSLYDLERRDNPASDSTIGFLDACDRYTDTFFDTHCLVLILLEESSGSNRHRVTSVQQDNSGKLYVEIETTLPEAGTCDMAQWHILLETTANIANEEAVSLSFQNNPIAADTAYFSDSFANMSLPIPDGWEYEITDDGIRLWPTGQTQGTLHLGYTDGFGVCGTGLRSETIALGGYEAEQGTYDDNTVWDYICISDTAGDYVIYNEGIDTWWSTYAEEAMEILSGITVADGVLHKAQAIKRAETVCDMEHPLSIARFDHESGMWTVLFYPDVYALSGEHCITVDAVSGEVVQVDCED